MLALRDQENLVHTHQTVAASKPLNQGARQLQPKTPGNRAPKTPFKVPLKDENDPLALGRKTVKTIGKQNENARPSVKDAFVTPMGDTRHRAPLGMKTTNAKARGLQTPAAPIGNIKPERTTKKGSTQRVKKFSPFVEQPQPEVKVQPLQDDVPDIEYMPPKPKDLPDYPEEITYDTSFPQFRPENLALGLESVYGDEIGSDGLTKRQRKFQKDFAAYDKMVDEMILKQIESIDFAGLSDDEQSKQPPVVELPQRRIQARNPRAASVKSNYSSGVSTVRARDAAKALSGNERTIPRTRVAPIMKPRARIASSLFPSKKPRAPANPSSMRHTAAAADSRTTVGYTKGREVSSRLHGTAKTSTKQPTKKPALSLETYTQPYGSPSLESEGDQLAEELFPTYEEDEETQNFQLTL
ncbi:hypothetical protein AN5687.2 [Aspergillus nidulans FGSC A4]|uniref:Uncharacterized protein n=1 Tax=Emericella nidulans (strain FGSC A4 / ATCC 38163 / CBS 112.46 / NRRL 194 / M139) TaxID=227321 RepID=Q5B193_EMENI|nr:hypothetical protein [Aspergillus nidulans FGSC A4]EAA62780.1 hypothetical protein AN5687.2 [Aspergillus nidulans FGSC A4]CBF81404.1 TPA: conserved hypothetical protein [Aspergillus nidulans FGSC A4]|eukprot:XP_663291.1 hypothetical protein AN5687.2 [Aspergillus nidulans FGSC A4]